jgi:hypothetical protein
MTKPNYDDPAVEERWCLEQQKAVAEYLKVAGVKHGRIGEWPAWHVAPYVSVWAIESTARPEWVGWWVISGDLPTDYISADSVKDPRTAVRGFTERWRDVASYMRRGEAHPTIRIGSADEQTGLGPLLESRATLLSKWVEDESLWQYE